MRLESHDHLVFYTTVLFSEHQYLGGSIDKYIRDDITPDPPYTSPERLKYVELSIRRLMCLLITVHIKYLKSWEFFCTFYQNRKLGYEAWW